MRRANRTALLFTVIVSLLSPVRAVQAQETEDRTLSPYFFVLTEKDEGSDLLPLKATEVKTDIAGVIADVKVTQVYSNTGNKPLEAIYIFPGSTRAAVYGMRMTIGERVRVAQIQKKETAKKTYAKAKKEGKSASLLEQERPNVFRMSVANIMPGDEIKVELSYTELLVPEEGVYEFVYPTVVGPRYSNQPRKTAPASERWIENPYLGEGQLPTYTFDIEVGLLAGLPIQEIFSPSHAIDASFEGKEQVQVTLSEKERFSGNRDYVLRYRLQGSEIESGLLLYEGEEENFFLLMAQPPKRVEPQQIPPREFIFVVDVSGSMYGFPLDTSKALMKNLVSALRPSDTFNVLLFSGQSALMAQTSVPATSQSIHRAIALIDGQRGGGGTELVRALQRAFTLPGDEKRSRTVVIVTDGYISFEAKAFDLIRSSLGNANIFPFGIGTSVNRHLIEGMARAGQGEPFVVLDPQSAPQTAERFRRYIQTPVLTAVDVQFDGFDAYAAEPQSIPDVLAERPVLLFGKWRGKPKGTIRIEGYSGEGIFTHTVDVADATPQKANTALRYLWARDRIAALSDYNGVNQSRKWVDEITTLGLNYNLLTAYTSFVAVDEVVRNTSGGQLKVKQPLPLPKGVSKLAVGESISTVPEPETYFLLCVVGLLLLWVAGAHREELYERIRLSR